MASPRGVPEFDKLIVPGDDQPCSHIQAMKACRAFDMPKTGRCLAELQILLYTLSNGQVKVALPMLA